MLALRTESLNALVERRGVGDVREIEESVGVRIRITLVMPNKVDARTNLVRELLGEIRATYPEDIALEHVPQSQDIKNAQSQRKTIFALEEPSTTAQRARDAYASNARELIRRLQEVHA